MVKLFRKNSNLCDHNSPTSQTDRQTTCDRNTALCTKVHRAVMITAKYLCNVTGFTTNSYLLLTYWIYLLVSIPLPVYNFVCVPASVLSCIWQHWSRSHCLVISFTSHSCLWCSWVVSSFVWCIWQWETANSDTRVNILAVTAGQQCGLMVCIHASSISGFDGGKR